MYRASSIRQRPSIKCRPDRGGQQWPPTSALGCASFASSEPMTSTIEIANGMNGSAPSALPGIPSPQLPLPVVRRRQEWRSHGRSFFVGVLSRRVSRARTPIAMHKYCALHKFLLTPS